MQRQFTEAIFTHGVLKPVRILNLRESEQVRLIVEKLDDSTTKDRKVLLARFQDGLMHMNFQSNGCLPSRDELHDRH